MDANTTMVLFTSIYTSGVHVHLRKGSYNGVDGREEHHRQVELEEVGESKGVQPPPEMLLNHIIQG